MLYREFMRTVFPYSLLGTSKSRVASSFVTCLWCGHQQEYNVSAILHLMMHLPFPGCSGCQPVERGSIMLMCRLCCVIVLRQPQMA